MVKFVTWISQYYTLLGSQVCQNILCAQLCSADADYVWFGLSESLLPVPLQCVCEVAASAESLIAKCVGHRVPAHELQFQRDQGQSYHGVCHCSDCLSAKASIN